MLFIFSFSIFFSTTFCGFGFVSERDNFSFMIEPEAPQRPDNAVEVQMPFIRHFFPNAQIAMMGIAASKEAIVIGESVGAICKNLGKDTVFVGSTDLTHYGPNYGYMPRGMGDEAVARECVDAAVVPELLDEEGVLGREDVGLGQKVQMDVLIVLATRSFYGLRNRVGCEHANDHRYIRR